MIMREGKTHTTCWQRSSWKTWEDKEIGSGCFKEDKREESSANKENIPSSLESVNWWTRLYKGQDWAFISIPKYCNMSMNKSW